MCRWRNAGVVDELRDTVHSLTCGTRRFRWSCCRRFESNAFARRSDKRLVGSAGSGYRGAAGVVRYRGERGGNAGILDFAGVGSGGGGFASPRCLAGIAGLLFLSFFRLFELALPRLRPDVTRSI
jgi:hypothetical protein